MANTTRHSILPSSTSSSAQSSYTTHLQSRIALKRAELVHLQQLRTLSADMASQMSLLEAKLATLRDGAEAVGLVMRNWEGVLGVISLVGGEVGRYATSREGREDAEKGRAGGDGEGELPVTLVRIPVESQEGEKKGEADEGAEREVSTA